MYTVQKLCYAAFGHVLALNACYLFTLKFYFSGAFGFFVKHVQTGMCINDTRKIQGNEAWGNLTFVELFSNCLDPAAQFRFRDNGAMSIELDKTWMSQS